MSTIAFFVIIAVAWGQTSQQAVKLLNQTTEKLRLYKTVSAKFDMIVENSQIDIKDRHSGTILMKGDKYFVSMPDLGLKVYSDGKSVWNFMETANQVTISNLNDEGAELFNPENIFTIYKEGYEAKYIGNKSEKGKNLAHIELFPNEIEVNNVEFEKITVMVDKDKLMLDRFTSHGRDGTIYGIEIKEFKPNIEIDDKDFIFDKRKYKDVETLDLR